MLFIDTPHWNDHGQEHAEEIFSRILCRSVETEDIVGPSVPIMSPSIFFSPKFIYLLLSINQWELSYFI